MNKQALGERIRALREGRQMSTTDLARQLGITPRTLTSIEKGIRGIKIDRLIAIVDIFDITLDYLILGRGSSPN
ncbi:MAG: helix-turn-helix domain-containing protein [Defluviitaleaceae bacterium]|nr:helix-turn-helix domain-containing protein [Defluviitaleaceae bacterium]